jgi:hypothetical protein
VHCNALEREEGRKGRRQRIQYGHVTEFRSFRHTAAATTSARYHGPLFKLTRFEGFQTPFTTPTQAQPRPPSASVYGPTPPRDGTAVQPLSHPHHHQQQTTSTPAKAITPAPATPAQNTPRVGGKWTHPALHTIEHESRKFMFGEQQLKTLIANIALLYVLYSATNRILERYICTTLEILIMELIRCE